MAVASPASAAYRAETDDEVADGTTAANVFANSLAVDPFIEVVEFTALGEALLDLLVVGVVATGQFCRDLDRLSLRASPAQAECPPAAKGRRGAASVPGRSDGAGVARLHSGAVYADDEVVGARFAGGGEAKERRQRRAPAGDRRCSGVGDRTSKRQA